MKDILKKLIKTILLFFCILIFSIFCLMIYIDNGPKGKDIPLPNHKFENKEVVLKYPLFIVENLDRSWSHSSLVRKIDAEASSYMDLGRIISGYSPYKIKKVLMIGEKVRIKKIFRHDPNTFYSTFNGSINIVIFEDSEGMIFTAHFTDSEDFDLQKIFYLWEKDLEEKDNTIISLLKGYNKNKKFKFLYEEIYYESFRSTLIKIIPRDKIIIQEEKKVLILKNISFLEFSNIVFHTYRYFKDLSEIK